MSLVSRVPDLIDLNRRYLLQRHRRRVALRTKPAEFFERLPTALFEEAPCVFVLSTGRCGTMLLTRILDKGGNLDAWHQPQPELVHPSTRAFAEIEKRPGAYDTAAIAARYDLIESSYTTDRVFVETNCRITFFAPSLARVFRRAKFIHVVRNPGAFIRSAYARGYYQDARSDRGHILPVTEEDRSEWENMTVLERIAWNWNATNEFIERFKSTMPQERTTTVRSEDLFKDPAVAERLIEYCGGTAPSSRRVIEAIIRKPVNVSVATRKPRRDWPARQAARIRAIATLSELYGYEI